jgi:hypothetical protein
LQVVTDEIKADGGRAVEALGDAQNEAGIVEIWPEALLTIEAIPYCSICIAQCGGVAMIDDERFPKATKAWGGPAMASSNGRFSR